MPHLQGGIENVDAPQPLPEMTPEMLALVRYPKRAGCSSCPSVRSTCRRPPPRGAAPGCPRE